MVIANYILYRIRCETQEVIRQYHSDPAMYSTLPAPEVVIPHYILQRIRVETQGFNRQYQSDPAMYSTLPTHTVLTANCTKFALKHKSLSVNIKAILPCTAL